MEKKFSELTNLSPVACSCKKPFSAKKNIDCPHSDSVITTLEQEIEEQVYFILYKLLIIKNMS